MRTKEEIQKELKLFEGVLEKVRSTTMFGDDNVAAVAAQIDVLKNYLDDDEIYNQYDRASSSEYVLDAAIHAREWMDGENEDDDDELAKGWPLKEGESL